MDNRFKVGDKVRVIKASTRITYYHVGDIFTITEVDTVRPWSNYKYKGIKEGSPFGLWLRNDDLVAVKQKHPVIVITTDGKETKARLIEGKTVLRESTAKCSDKDTFDFETGAKLAFERLFGKEEPKKIEPQVGKNYIVKEDCTNIWNKVVLKAGDIVTVGTIDNDSVYLHGFSRTENKFTDMIHMRRDMFPDKFKEYPADESKQD